MSSRCNILLQNEENQDILYVIRNFEVFLNVFDHQTHPNKIVSHIVHVYYMLFDKEIQTFYKHYSANHKREIDTHQYYI